MKKEEIFDGIKNLRVKPSKIEGLGVFAAKDFQPKEIIEECPAVVFDYTEALPIHKKIYDRVFYWSEKTKGALALGYGSIYNHSDNPKADFKIDNENNLIKVFATKPIATGEEILIDYGKDWFISRKKAAEQEEKQKNIRRNKLLLILFSLIMLSIFFPKNNPIENILPSKKNNTESISRFNDAKYNIGKTI